MSNKAKWRNFTKEEIEKIVSESYSNREVARKLGYSQDGGGTMASIKKMYEELELDTSHFKGQGWNKNNYNYDIYTENSYKKKGKSFSEPIIALRGRKCEECGIEEWLGKPINLEVHHKDGNRMNNDLNNLVLLCPNCHSYTPNFAGKNNHKDPIPEEQFVQALKDSKTIRKALILLNLTPAGANYDRAHELIDKYNLEHLK
jgi:hypothetical protein